jgi:hypothetical protein
MTAPYGLGVRDDLIEQGVGNSYGEMCVMLLAGLMSDELVSDELVSDELMSAERPADLLVLATAIPDVRLGRATATFLSRQCPGDPLAFAVSDQGQLAAFTALELVGAYMRTGACRRAVLLVAEQPTLFHDLAMEETPVPELAAAVGVVLEADATPDALSVRRHLRPAEHELSQVLAAETARLSGDRTVILGPGLYGADAGLDGDVRVCDAEMPFTGSWFELARALPEMRKTGGQIMIADYDRTQGVLFSVTMRCDG